MLYTVIGVWTWLFLSIYMYFENDILKDCVITLEYVEIVFVSIVAVKQNVLNADGCFHSSESYLRQVGGKDAWEIPGWNSNSFVLSQAVKKDVPEQKNGLGVAIIFSNAAHFPKACWHNWYLYVARENTSPCSSHPGLPMSSAWSKNLPWLLLKMLWCHFSRNLWNSAGLKIHGFAFNFCYLFYHFMPNFLYKEKSPMFSC